MADEQAVPQTSPTPPEQPQPAAPEQAPDAPTTDPQEGQPAAADNPDPVERAESNQQTASDLLAKAYEQGFFAEASVDPRPNSDYSLESGPDSPSALEQQRDAAQAEVDRLDAHLNRDQQEG